MARRRTRGRNSSGKGPSQPEMKAAAITGAEAPRALEGLRPTNILRKRLFARSVVWLVVAGVAVIIAGTGGWLWSRQQFNMVKTLAYLAEHEGTWDNPWDLQDKKIASLQTDIRAEASPIKRLILRRELAQQHIAGGLSLAGIGIIEQLLAEYGQSLPPADIETLNADLAFAYFRLGELQNCTWNHNSDFCIIPVQGEGVHKEQLGAKEAAKRYAVLLADPATNPENALLYRWLGRPHHHGQR